MTSFRLSESINKNKVFLVNKSRIEKRLDPFYYIPELTQLEEQVLKKSPQKLFHYAKAFSSGATPKTTESEKYYTDAENGIPFLRVQNLSTTSILNFDNLKYINEETHNGMLARSKVKGGDLLIKITGVGRMAVSSVAPEDFKGNVNQHMVVMKTNSHETSKILAAYLNSDIGEKLASRRATGGTRPALDYPALLSIPIIYDKRILEITSAAVNKKEAKEQQAKDLLASIDDHLLREVGIKLPKQENRLQNRMFAIQFSQATGNRIDPNFHFKNQLFLQINPKYPFINLKEVLASAPQYGANEEAIDGNPNTDTRYIRITDIDNWGNLKNNDDWKTAPKVEEKYSLENNDILFARSGSVGRCFLYKAEYGKAIFAGYLIRFKIDTANLLPEFLFYYAYSSIYKHWVDMIQRPAVQANINSEEFKNMLIPLPSIKKQNEIATHIRQLREQAKQLQQEANKELEKASREVAQVILGEENI